MNNYSFKSNIFFSSKEDLFNYYRFYPFNKIDIQINDEELNTLFLNCPIQTYKIETMTKVNCIYQSYLSKLYIENKSVINLYTNQKLIFLILTSFYDLKEYIHEKHENAIFINRQIGNENKLPKILITLLYKKLIAVLNKDDTNFIIHKVSEIMDEINEYSITNVPKIEKKVFNKLKKFMGKKEFFHICDLSNTLSNFILTIRIFSILLDLTENEMMINNFINSNSLNNLISFNI